MTTLIILCMACAIGAIALGVVAAVLLRGRARTERPLEPTAMPADVPAEPVRAAARLPGMPLVHQAPPPSWAAVERELEPRSARGSAPPMRKLAANRFDDVLTTGLPVVTPQQQKAFAEDDAVEDDPSAPAAIPPARR